MIVHASNEADKPSGLRTLCCKAYARSFTKGWRKAMSGLLDTAIASCTHGLTQDSFEPILPHFAQRVTCPLCRDVVRQKVAALQQGLGVLERPEVEGCGDSGCICRAPSGMATNGGCRCDDRAVRRALSMWRRYARDLEARIE